MQRINFTTSRIELKIGETAKVSKEIQTTLNLPTRFIQTREGTTCDGCVFNVAEVDCETVLQLQCVSSYRTDHTSVIFTGEQ
jgi:hypothetical protein